MQSLHGRQFGERYGSAGRGGAGGGSGGGGSEGEGGVYPERWIG